MSPRKKPGRVGVEIEFAGLNTREAADAIVATPRVGGKVVMDGPHAAHLEGGALDTARVELDSRYARKVPADEADFFDEMLEAFNARDMAADAASFVAPVELSAPPLPEDKLHIIDTVIGALRDAGATGTTESPFAAYGLHLNCELVPPDPQLAVRVATAYAFAEEWVRYRAAPDLTRRATPYVDPYPVPFTYELSVSLRRGDLNLQSFLQLYAFWCPTRNHGLDMWPLLGWLDPEAANRAAKSKIKAPRPAFHYRLPNSNFADPEWSLKEDLEVWRMVERIGEDPEKLDEAGEIWLERVSWRMGAPTYRRRIEELGA